MQDIDQVSDSTIKDWFQSIDTVLFDIDGVLVHNKAVISGSDDAVRTLRSMGKNVGFITNNTLYDFDRLLNNLELFEAKHSEVLTPISALMHYLNQSYPKEKDIYAITNTVPVKYMKEAGYNVIEYEDIQSTRLGENFNEIVQVALKALDKCKNVGLVFIDTDVNVCHGALQVAQLILNHKTDVQLVLGIADDIVPVGHNMKFICGQYYIDAIQRWTGKEGISVAKPSKVLTEVINIKFNVTDPGRVLIIGDNVSTDIALGVLAGYKTCLVLSGVCTKEQVINWQYPEEWKPNFIAEKLADLCTKLN